VKFAVRKLCLPYGIQALQIAPVDVLHKRGGKRAMPDYSQFNIGCVHPGQSAVTFSNPPVNVLVPTTVVRRAGWGQGR
jgi:hypothetical protein